MSSTLLSLLVTMQDQSHIETDSIAWGLIYQFGELSILHHRLTFIHYDVMGGKSEHLMKKIHGNTHVSVLSCKFLANKHKNMCVFVYFLYLVLTFTPHYIKTDKGLLTVAKSPKNWPQCESHM